MSALLLLARAAKIHRVIPSVTWDAGYLGADLVLSNGNLTVDKPSGANTFKLARATTSKSTGKLYCEFHIDAKGGDTFIGVVASTESVNSYPGNTASSYGIYELTGHIANNATDNGAYFPGTWAAGNVIGMAIDLNAGKLWWHLNGTYPSSGDPATGTSPAYTGLSGAKYPAVSIYEGTSLAKVTARFVAASWTYSAPSGFGEWTP